MIKKDLMQVSYGPSADLVDEYLSFLRESDYSPRSIAGRAEILTRADRQLPHGLDQANQRELRLWVFREDLKPQSKATYYNALISFYRYCVESGHLDHNPMEGIRRPKVPAGVPRPARDEDVRNILARATEPYRTWAIIASYEGARCIEIARLSREDITRETTYLFGKGDKPRAVDTHPLVWETVQSFSPGPIGLGLTARQISIRSAVYFRQKLGIPASMHMLRCWYLTKILEVSGDPRLAQVLAGHSSLNTTMVYLAVAPGRRRSAVMSLPRLA